MSGQLQLETSGPADIPRKGNGPDNPDRAPASRGRGKLHPEGSGAGAPPISKRPPRQAATTPAVPGDLHDQVRAEERVARKRERDLEKARRVKARKRETEAERERREKARRARAADAKAQREYEASLAEDSARQCSIVYPERELAEAAVPGWRRRGYRVEVEHVRTKGGRQGFAVMEVRA